MAEATIDQEKENILHQEVVQEMTEAQGEAIQKKNLAEKALLELEVPNVTTINETMTEDPSMTIETELIETTENGTKVHREAEHHQAHQEKEAKEVDIDEIKK